MCNIAVVNIVRNPNYTKLFFLSLLVFAREDDRSNPFYGCQITFGEINPSFALRLGCQ